MATAGFDKHPENINRLGRPKGVSITSLVKSALEQVPEGDTRTYAQVIAEMVLKKAVEGDTQMLRLLWQFVDGMPKQGVEVGVGDISRCEVVIVEGNAA